MQENEQSRAPTYESNVLVPRLILSSRAETSMGWLPIPNQPAKGDPSRIHSRDIALEGSFSGLCARTHPANVQQPIRLGQIL